MKTVVYVDGYNLFYGCLKHSQDKWLDLKRLFADHILHAQCPDADLVRIKYFTAPIRAKVATRGDQAMEAQSRYHRALGQLYPDLIDITYGYYSLEKAYLLAWRQPPDKTDRVAVWRLEEKQTDVNVALTAYRDAAKGLGEQLVFVSNDSDLIPALSAIREDFGDRCTIGLILPIRKDASGPGGSERKRRPGNVSLAEHADWTRRHIRAEELEASQLPDMVATGRKPIRKPEYW